MKKTASSEKEQQARWHVCGVATAGMQQAWQAISCLPGKGRATRQQRAA